MKRKAYKLKAGNLANLKLENIDVVAPLANEVVIKVKAIGLNFADIFAIWGLYSATPKGTFIPGLEYSGEIIQIGSNVTQHEVGDRIMGVTRFGAYADKITIGEEYVIPLPEYWNYQEGAAYLVQALTAYYGLFHLGGLKKGGRVLIHSAAGGVGIFAGRMARAAGAITMGSVGSSEKIPFCKKEGYHKVIVRSKNFGADLDSALAGEQVNVIMECIGGKIFKESYERLAPEGKMVVYGSARYASPGNKPNYFKLFYQFLTRPKIDPQKMIELNRGVLGFNLIYLYDRSVLLHQLLTEIKTLNIGKPVVGHEFKFDELLEALRLFQTGKTIGKVVVLVD